MILFVNTWLMVMCMFCVVASTKQNYKNKFLNKFQAVSLQTRGVGWASVVMSVQFYLLVQELHI